MIAAFAALLTSCSGGGGGSNTPAPTVQLQAEPSNDRLRRDDDAHLVEHGCRTAARRPAAGAARDWCLGSEDVGPRDDRPRPSRCSARARAAPPRPAPPSRCWRATARSQDSLLVPTISRSDSDVNDPFAPFAPNDTDLQAQVMPNPVVIGGYLNDRGRRPDRPAARSPAATSTTGTGSTSSPGRSSSS